MARIVVTCATSHFDKSNLISAGFADEHPRVLPHAAIASASSIRLNSPSIDRTFDVSHSEMCTLPRLHSDDAHADTAALVPIAWNEAHSLAARIFGRADTDGPRPPPRRAERTVLGAAQPGDRRRPPARGARRAVGLAVLTPSDARARAVPPRHGARQAFALV